MYISITNKYLTGFSVIGEFTISTDREYKHTVSMTMFSFLYDNKVWLLTILSFKTCNHLV